jgi:hypothetical protein
MRIYFYLFFFCLYTNSFAQNVGINNTGKAPHPSAMLDVNSTNKGAHTIEVLEMLKDISQRQSEHRSKKRYTFRPLSIAKEFIDK